MKSGIDRLGNWAFFAVMVILLLWFWWTRWEGWVGWLVVTVLWGIIAAKSRITS